MLELARRMLSPQCGALPVPVVQRHNIQLIACAAPVRMSSPITDHMFYSLLALNEARGMALFR